MRGNSRPSDVGSTVMQEYSIVYNNKKVELIIKTAHTFIKKYVQNKNKCSYVTLPVYINTLWGMLMVPYSGWKHLQHICTRKFRI